MRIRSLAAALSTATLLVGCSPPDAATSEAPAARGTLYIVGVDVSGSRKPTQLLEGQRLMDGLIDRMTNGDKLVVLQTYQAGTDASEVWEEAIPPARTPGRPNGADVKKAEQFRRTARLITATFFDSTKTKNVMTTDLLFTIGRAADHARASGGRGTVLVLMSDMLNATPELNMERKGGVPDERWIAQRKAQNRLPDLRGVCVVVAGADVSSSRGAATRVFWSAYFKAVGAELPASNYRNMISDAGEVACEGA